MAIAGKGLALSVLAGTAVLALSWESKTLESLRRFNPGWFIPLAGIVVTAWCLNGLRTWILARSLGHPLTLRQSVAITLSAEFAIAATPGGMGGLLVRFALQRRAGIPISTSSSMLMADILADFLFFGSLAPFAIVRLGRTVPWDSLPGFISLEGGLGLLAVPVVTGAGFYLFFLNRVGFQRMSFLLRRGWVERQFRLASRLTHWRRKFRSGIANMARTTAYFWSHRRLAFLACVGLACGQLTCRYSVLPLVIAALGQPVDPVPLVILQGIFFLLGLLVVIPGGGGTVELFSSLVLPAFVTRALIGPTILIWRFFTYYFYLIGGGTTFFLVLRHRQKLFPGNAPLASVEAPPTPTGE